MIGRKFMLNPDHKVVAEVRDGIKAKGGYCPCKVGKEDRNKCPCVDFMETGICICGLYIYIGEV